MEQITNGNPERPHGLCRHDARAQTTAAGSEPAGGVPSDGQPHDGHDHDGHGGSCAQDPETAG
jgi:hypothetical protein